MKTATRMKRTLPLIILFLLVDIFTSNLQAQCSVSIAVADSTICNGDSITLTANPLGPDNPLLTTLAAGNNHRGNMFDLYATNTITITSFDAHPLASTNIAIYYRPSPYAGFTTSAAGWTLIGSVPVTFTGTATPIPIQVNVTIPAGQTYSFYITSTNAVSLNYSNGTTEGATFVSDTNLTFREGVGMEYPFTNGTSMVYTPRIWNGIIHYALPATSSYVWSTGSTNPSITVTPATTTLYSVDVNIAACGASSASQNIIVGNPVVDLGADQSACVDGIVMLDAALFSSYNWNTTDTTQTITLDGAISGAGTTAYTVIVTDSIGCSNTDTVNITFNALPSIDIGADQYICANDSLLLDAGAGFTNYTWSTTANTQTQIVNASFGLGTTELSVTVMDTNTCSNADTVQLTLLAPPTVDLGTNDTICNSGSVLLDAGAASVTYLWLNGATTQTIIADGAVLGVGAHPISVEVTDSFGCTNADTVTVNVLSCVGIDENNAQINLSIYPNPATELINLNIDSEIAREMNISILNEIGQTMLIQKWNCSIGNQSKTVDVSNLSAGIYLVQIELNGRLFTRKMMIR